MTMWGLLVAVCLATSDVLIQAVAAQENTDNNIGNELGISPEKEPARGSSRPLTKLQHLFGRFDKCKLPRNPKPADLVAFRICIKRILEKEGGTDVGGRWGRSVGDKLTRQVAKVENILLVRRHATGASGVKTRRKRSLDALCAGDLSHYNSEVREYIQWRCKNGYGQLMRRWGRAAAASASGSAASPSGSLKYHENDILQTGYFGTKARSDHGYYGALKMKKPFDNTLRTHKIFLNKDRAKRENEDELRAIVEAYREWRSQNGYGQTSGRWG